MERPTVYYLDGKNTQAEIDRDFKEGIRIIDKLNMLIANDLIDGLAQYEIAELCDTGSKIIGAYLSRKVTEGKLRIENGLYYRST